MEHVHEKSRGTERFPARGFPERLVRRDAHVIERQRGGGESQTRHGFSTARARFTAASILLDTAAAATPNLDAILTSLRMAAISSWYCFMRRSKVRRSF